MSRIVVVGGINMDLHLFDLHPSVGQAPMVADHYLAEPGGKGANVARAVSRLGCPVSLVARIGEDEFGQDCVRVIAADGVETSGISTAPGVATGFVAIELDEGRHRSLIYAPGANDSLVWSDVEPHLRDVGQGDIVIAQAEVPAETLARLADHTIEAGASLFLDPTPTEHATSTLISRASVITPNRKEAAALVGRSDTSPLWPMLAAKELIAAGATRVVIKLGASGAIFADHDQIVEVPTISVESVDETGAGDVFIATLAVGRSDGMEWIEATEMANVAAAISLSQQGLFLPDRIAVDEALASNEDR